MVYTPTQELRRAFADLVNDALVEWGVMSCCISCASFNEEQELCGLCDPPTRPPARVITFGCPSFHEDLPVHNGSGVVAYAKEPDAASFSTKPSKEDVVKMNEQWLVKKHGGNLDWWDDDIPF